MEKDGIEYQIEQYHINRSIHHSLIDKTQEKYDDI